MDVQKIIAEVKKHVSSADIEEALEKLNQFLEQKKGQYEGLQDTLLQIQSQYFKTRKDEDMGLINPQDAKINYNQTINQLLKLLDELEAPLRATNNSRKTGRRSLYAVLGMLALVVIAMVLYRTIGEIEEDPIPPDQVLQADCPEYDSESIFNIMILPFRPFDDKVQNIHEGIQERFGVLSDEEEIRISPKILRIDTQNQDYPKTATEAQAIASNCIGTQLIIWGTTETPSNSIITRTRFKFLDADNYLQFSKLEVEDLTLIDTINTISSIPTEGQVTGEIESLLLAIIAHMTNNEDAAIAFLESYTPQDSTGVLYKGMILADSYLKKDEPEKAMAAYDQVIEKHPDYWLARNNRGILFFNKGQYAEAVNDLNVRLKKNPDDLNALTVRGVSLLRSEQLAEAAKDLSNVVKKAPDNTFVKEKYEETATKIRIEESKQRTAKRSLQADPNNLNALNELAETSARLGDYQTTKETTSRILEIDPKSLTAYVNRIKAAWAEKNVKEARKVLQEAMDSGISKERLLKADPVIKALFENPRDPLGAVIKEKILQIGD